MPRRPLIVCAGEDLCASFFAPSDKTIIASVLLDPGAARIVTPGLRPRLTTAGALIPARGSPHFVRSALRQLDYHDVVSFECENKWHPEIADANIALPHFTRRFWGTWNHE